MNGAFTWLGLHRVWARHFSENPASGKVLAKVGMTHEGCLRSHFLRWGVFHDIELYGVLGSEYDLQKKALA